MSSVCYKLPVCSEATLPLPVFPKCTQSTLFSLAQYPWFSFCTFPRPFIPFCHDLLGTILFCFSLLQKPTHTSSLAPTFSQQVLTTKEESTNQIPIDRPPETGDRLWAQKKMPSNFSVGLFFSVTQGQSSHFVMRRAGLHCSTYGFLGSPHFTSLPPWVNG